jgi:hypothetical protein
MGKAMVTERNWEMAEQTLLPTQTIRRLRLEASLQPTLQCQTSILQNLRLIQSRLRSLIPIRNPPHRTHRKSLPSPQQIPLPPSDRANRNAECGRVVPRNPSPLTSGTTHV